MKRNLSFISVVICIFAITPSFAQSSYGAYLLGDYQRQGTARSVAMGNAMTALGGDLGAIAINPAATAVYKYNEVSITPAVTSVNTYCNYLGAPSTDKRSTFGIANIGGVSVINTGANYGIKSISIGVSYNKQNNFNYGYKAAASGVDHSYSRYLADLTNAYGSYYSPRLSGYDLDKNDHTDPYTLGSALWPSILGWNASLFDTLATDPCKFVPNKYAGAQGYRSTQSIRRKSYGSIGEYDLNFGLNISDKLYIGMNMGLFTVWNKVEETYSEDNEIVGSTDAFAYVDQVYNLRTTGAGVNFKFGFIWTPSTFFRLGGAVSTPTWYQLKDKYYWDMSVGYNDGYNAMLSSPEGEYDYRINTPFQYNVGMAFVLPNGTISLDYEANNLAQTRFRNKVDVESFDKSDFSYENNFLKTHCSNSHNLRVGVEINPISLLSLRGGFQYTRVGLKSDYFGQTSEKYIASAGFGINTPSGFFADFAVAANLKKYNVNLFDDEPGADYMLNSTYTGIKRNGFQVLATFGWRF